MKVRILYIILIAISLLSGVFLSAQDLSSHEERKARLERDIEILDRQLSENESKSRSALSKLTLIRAKITSRKALVAESDRLIRRYSDEIYLSQKSINKLNSRIDTLSRYYERLVLSAYKNRDAKVWYMYILASDDLGQAFRRYSYFKNLSGEMRRQAENIREARKELEIRKSELEDLKTSAEKVRKERQSELSSLQKEEIQSSQTVNLLKRSRTKYEKELASKKKQVDALDREIKRLIAEAMKDNGSSGKPQKQEIDYVLDAEFSKNKGKLPWPVDGAVVDSFGQHYHPVFKTVKLPFNNGISIAVPKGTRVKAVFDGVVKRIVVMPGYNQCILVQHGNWFSFYCKLQSTAVKAGDKVKTGQVLGTVDTINGDTQLHFQIWQKQTPQNPEAWLRKR